MFKYLITQKVSILVVEARPSMDGLDPVGPEHIAQIRRGPDLFPTPSTFSPFSSSHPTTTKHGLKSIAETSTSTISERISSRTNLGDAETSLLPAPLRFVNSCASITKPRTFSTLAAFKVCVCHSTTFHYRTYIGT